MMGVYESIKRALAFRSGNICAKCHKELTVDYSDGTVKAIGQCAHIEGEHGGNPAFNKPPAARYNPSMTDQERNSFPNLIYLCSNCHTEIDKIPEGERDFPVSVLRNLKSAHESTVRKAIIDAFPEVGFNELAEATKWARQFSALEASPDYSLLPVDKKLKRNGISIENRAVIAAGLSVANEVAKYIKIVAQADDHFPEKLKAGFLEEYYRLVKLDCKGDSLFEGMCCFAQKGMKRQVDKTAGLAVLIHFFETCEVFEK